MRQAKLRRKSGKIIDVDVLLEGGPDRWGERWAVLQAVNGRPWVVCEADLLPFDGETSAQRQYQSRHPAERGW